MLCAKCQRPMDPEDARKHGGASLYEHWYIDALSHARTCDPWAVYTHAPPRPPPRRSNRLPEQIISPAQEKPSWASSTASARLRLKSSWPEPD